MCIYIYIYSLSIFQAIATFHSFVLGVGVDKPKFSFLLLNSKLFHRMLLNNVTSNFTNNPTHIRLFTVIHLWQPVRCVLWRSKDLLRRGRIFKMAAP